MGYDEFGPAYPDPDKPQPTNHDRTVRLLMLVLGLVLGVFTGLHLHGG